MPGLVAIERFSDLHRLEAISETAARAYGHDANSLIEIGQTQVSRAAYLENLDNLSDVRAKQAVVLALHLQVDRPVRAEDYSRLNSVVHGHSLLE